MTEAWKPIPEFPGYEASSLGQIRSWRAKNGGRLAEPVILKQQRQTCGGRYKIVSVQRDNAGLTVLVHRLVCTAFHGPRPDGKEVRHYPDRDPRNVTAANLSWATHAENEADKRVHDTLPSGARHWRATSPERGARGARVGTTKTCEGNVRVVLMLLHERIAPRREIGIAFGLSKSGVAHIHNRESWNYLQ